MRIKKIKLSDIVLDGGTDVRAEINEDVVNEYGEAAKCGDKFPPLIVFDTDKGLLLADGFHRAYGFERFGITHYECDIRKGTREDALKFALGCNTEHGYRRTNADKQNSVKIALKEFADLSDRMIADMCHVSHPMVGPVRKAMAPPPPPRKAPASSKGSPQPPEPASPPPKRKGKDGKSYKVATPAKATTVDATNYPVPEEIIPHWNTSLSESTRQLTLVSEVRTRLKLAENRNEPMFRHVNLQDSISKLDLIYAELNNSKPFAVCIECQGVQTHQGDVATSNNRCASCKGNGWVPKFFWENCVPSELKKAAGRE